ncbi:MAG: efflux RND transporter periplasmic adaptor subunit [Candidatus Eremiobacteraeota bacterium]|nr:efflux RND transporter periplasmic adaptor subunit [Candidatus Eremiobacteraeota bacterium]
MRVLPALLALAVAAGCAHAQKPAAAPYVATTIATFGSIHPAETLAGIIAPYENVAVQSTLSEPADSVNVQEGDTVHKGEVLAQLDTADLQAQYQSDLATAQSSGANTTHNVYQGSLSIQQGLDSLRQAQGTLANDQSNLTRDQHLFAQGYVSQQALQQQQTLVRNDQAAVAAAGATVAANGSLTGQGLQSSSVAQSRAQEQVALAQAQQVRVAIDKATLYSPIDGVVVNRNLNAGEYPGNRQLFTIQQMDPVYAVLHASADQVARIKPGAPAAVTVAGAGTLRVTGNVSGVLNQIVPGSTDFIVKVLLHNPDRKLRSGMPVSASIALPALSGVRVPQTAFIDDNHDSLLTVSNDGVVKTAKVAEVGGDGTTSVVSGVDSGTRVVTNGQVSVGDGERVSFQQ